MKHFRKSQYYVIPKVCDIFVRTPKLNAGSSKCKYVMSINNTTMQDSKCFTALPFKADSLVDLSTQGGAALAALCFRHGGRKGAGLPEHVYVCKIRLHSEAVFSAAKPYDLGMVTCRIKGSSINEQSFFRRCSTSDRSAGY